MPRFSPLLALLAPLLLVLLLSPSPSLAITRQKSCRECSCESTFTGATGDGSDAAIDGFMGSTLGKLTGGDGYVWEARPFAPSWHGNVKFWRLCGNGGNANTQQEFSYFPQGKTTLKLSCMCSNSVRCLGGSKCEDSGL